MLFPPRSIPPSTFSASPSARSFSVSLLSSRFSSRVFSVPGLLSSVMLWVPSCRTLYATVGAVPIKSVRRLRGGPSRPGACLAHSGGQQDPSALSVGFHSLSGGIACPHGRGAAAALPGRVVG